MMALRKRWPILVLALAAIGGGVALGCDGNYCAPFDDRDCVVLDTSTQDTCCVNLGGSTRSCATCTRDDYLCWAEGAMLPVQGPAYNCYNPGAVCQ